MTRSEPELGQAVVMSRRGDPFAPVPHLNPETVSFLLAWQALEGASRRAREAFARRAGLGLIDFQALLFLSAEQGRPTKTVGEALHLSSGAVTALVDRLSDAGYLLRRPHPTDRRSTLLHLTADGAAAASEAGALFASAAETVIAPSDLPHMTTVFAHLAAFLQTSTAARES